MWITQSKPQLLLQIWKYNRTLHWIDHRGVSSKWITVPWETGWSPQWQTVTEVCGILGGGHEMEKRGKGKENSYCANMFRSVNDM